MINIVNGNTVEFEDYKFEKHVVKMLLKTMPLQMVDQLQSLC